MVGFYQNICFDKSDFPRDMPQELHDSVARLKSTAPLNSIMLLSKRLNLHYKNSFETVLVCYGWFRIEMDPMNGNHLSVRENSVISA